MATKRRTTGQILGERVRHYRERADLSQEGLAQRTAGLGQPMNRVTIAKIERAGRPDCKPADRTRADNASLVDVLVLAAALDVAPPLLFIPLGEEEEVEFGNIQIHPHLLLKWVVGDGPLTNSKRYAIRHGEWKENSAPIFLFQELRGLQDRMHSAEARQVYAERSGDAEAMAVAGRNVDRVLRELDRHLDYMRHTMRSVPKMPKAWTVRMAELRVMPDDER